MKRLLFSFLILMLSVNFSFADMFGVGSGGGGSSVDDLITLSGMAEGSVNLETFTGSIISDNVAIKTALQQLETYLEAVKGLGSALSSSTDTLTSTGDINVKLGDAAGSNKLSVKDSSGAEVGYWNSDGVISATQVNVPGADGSRQITVTNNSSISPTASSYQLYPESGWKMNNNGTESTIVGNDTTQTLTNKRITPRVGSTTSSATPTINTDNYDAYSITALATDITSMTTNLSGTPTNFQSLIIRFKDDGTGRGITWGASFEAKGVTLPTTTTASKVLTVGFLYDSVTSKWGCVASVEEQ